MTSQFVRRLLLPFLLCAVVACVCEGKKRLGSWDVDFRYNPEGNGSVTLWVSGAPYTSAVWVALDENLNPLDGGDVINGEENPLPEGTELVGIGVGSPPDFQVHFVEIP